MFITIERSLGELDRARSLYRYMANYADPDNPLTEQFWEEWSRFEVVYGDESGYRDFIHTKRAVESK